MIVIAESPAAAVRVARHIGSRAGYPSLADAYDRLDGFPLPERKRLYVIEVPASEYAAPSRLMAELVKAGMVTASFAANIAATGVASLWEGMV